jgi:hypothetical protein
MERDDTRRGRAKRVGDCSRWLSREQNVADGSGGASETRSREPFRDAGHRQPGMAKTPANAGAEGVKRRHSQGEGLGVALPGT